MTLIRIPSWKFNGDNPVVDGQEVVCPRDVAFEASDELIDVLDQSCIYYTLVKGDLTFPSSAPVRVPERTSGKLRQIDQLLGNGSVLALAQGSHPIFALSGTDLITTGPIGLGDRKAIIAESLGDLHAQYPLNYTGIAGDTPTTVIPNPKPFDPAQTWENDFEAVADDTTLRSLNGWEDYAAFAGNGGTRDSLKVVGGKLLGGIRAGDGTWQSGTHVVRNLGVLKQTILLEGVNLDTDGDGAANTVLIVVVGANPATGAYLAIRYYPPGSIGVNISDGTQMLVSNGSGGQFPNILLNCNIEIKLLDTDSDGVPDRMSIKAYDGNMSVSRTYDIPANARSALGTYAGFGSSTANNLSIDKITMSGDAAYPDTRVTATAVAEIASAVKATSTIAYYAPTPAAYEIRVYSGATEVIAWEPALVVENATAGTATLATTTPIAAQWKGNELTVSVRRAGDAGIQSGVTHYGTGISLGQNASVINSLFARRAYTNMLVQANWQDPLDGWNVVYTNDPATAYLQVGNNPPPIYTGVPRISATGHPLKSGLNLNFCGPDWDGTTKTIVLEWDGGNVSLISLRCGYHAEADASLTALNGTRHFAGANNRITFRFNPPNTLNANGSYGPNYLSCTVNINEASPPTNMRMYVEGDDLSQRFTPAFIAMTNELGGPIRHMDGLQMNKHDNIVKHGVAWSQRSTRASIAVNSHPLGICLEDMAELSVLTNRPLWWNITPAMAYSPAGLDHLDKAVKLMWAGTGSGTTAKLSDINQPLYIEAGNELWNMGAFVAPHWMAQQHMTAGWYPATVNHGGDPVKPFATWMANMSERLWAHRQISRVVEPVVPSEKLVRVFGVQHGGVGGGAPDLSAILNPSQGLFTLPNADCGWNDGAGIDMISYAQYVGGDHNGGGGASMPPSSPAPSSVAAWLRAEFIAGDVNSQRWNSFARSYGKKVGQYEFGFNVGSINMTAAEEWALRSSTAYKAVAMEIFTSLSRVNEGPVCLYSDIGGIIATPEGGGYVNRWGNYVFPGSPANKGWEAASEWWAEYVSEGGDT